MEKSFSKNEKAPQRGFLTLAHAGDPTPANWIGLNLICGPVRRKIFIPLLFQLDGQNESADSSSNLGRQLLRSGTSVGANYREAARSRSKAEFIAKMGDCLKEVDESDFWLALIEDEKVLSSSKLQSIRRETRELTAIFVSSLNTTKANAERKMQDAK